MPRKSTSSADSASANGAEHFPLQLDIDPHALGEMMRTIRRLRGQTLQEVATNVGISEAYLSLIENGKRTPSLDNLRALAISLAIPLWQMIFLASGTDQKQAPVDDIVRMLRDDILSALFQGRRQRGTDS